MKKTTLFMAAALMVQYAGAQSIVQGRLDNVRRLTNDNVRYENPRWSPDGTRISYTNEGYDGLYVMLSDGTQAKKLTDASGVGYMHQWSADSHEILVRDTRWKSGSFGSERVHAAWAVKLDGSKVRMTKDAETMYPAAWRYNAAGQKSIVAPGVEMVAATLPKMAAAAMKTPAVTGSNISYICDCDHLILVDAAGNQRIINNAPSFCPSTSPDGKKVAFNQSDDIVVMNIDGTGKRVIGRGYNASWVNNSQIVFEVTSDDGHRYTSGDLFIINIDGTGRKALTTTGNRIEMNPCVSADGKKVVFTDNIDGQVYVADLK